MVIFLQNRNGLMITLLEKKHQKQKIFTFRAYINEVVWLTKKSQNFVKFTLLSWIFFEKMYVFCQFTSGFHEKWSIIGYFRKIRFLITPPLTEQLGINFRWWFEIKCIILPPCGPETEFYLFTFLPQKVKR